jgi:hypothetical protein
MAAGGVMIILEQREQVVQIPGVEVVEDIKASRIELAGDAGGEAFVFEKQFDGFVDDVFGRKEGTAVEAVGSLQTSILVPFLKAAGQRAAILTMDGTAGWVNAP